MPRTRTKASNLTSERDEAAHKKAFKSAGDKFDKASARVDKILPSLFRKSKRAKEACKLLEHGRHAFIEALKALQENEDASNEACERQRSLVEAEELHQINPDSTSHYDQLVEATQRVSDAQKTEESTANALAVVINKVNRVHSELVQDTISNFDTRLVRRTQEISDDDRLETLSNDVRYMLEKRSMINLLKALLYWEKAYEAQMDISRVYKEEQISKLRNEADKLQSDVREERSGLWPNTAKIGDAANRMKQIRVETNAVILQREDKKKLQRAEHELQKACAGMASIRKKVESAEHKEELKTEQKTEEGKGSKKSKKFGFKRLASRKKEDDADSISERRENPSYVPYG